MTATGSKQHGGLAAFTVALSTYRTSSEAVSFPLAQLILVSGGGGRGEMSAEHFREFVNERLAAAAEEIFGAFRRTVVEYEGEIDRQRRMLETFCKPEIRLHRIGVYIQR